MKKNDGVTLIELIIVFAIIGILVVVLNVEFRGWVGSYHVESQIKDLQVDLINARARAMQRNRVHFVDFPDASSYAIYEDDSDGASKVPDGDGEIQKGGTGSGYDTRLPSYPKSLEYAVKIGTTGAEPPITFAADNRGLIGPARSICVFTDFDNDKISDYNPDYDCIIISETRVNIGKLKKQDTNGGQCKSAADGGDCEAK